MINANHTTSLLLVYRDGTYPTPWPWVLGSMLLSLILASISVWTSWKKRRRSNVHPAVDWEKALVTLAAAGVFVSTTRSFATFILTCRVMQTGSGRVGSSSSLAVLLASLGISIVNYSLPPFSKYVVQMDFMLVFISVLMAFGYGRVQTYGTLKVTGGNCAFQWENNCVERLVSDISLSPSGGHGGCPAGFPNIYSDYLDNPIRITEVVILTIGLFYGIYIIFRTVNTLRVVFVLCEIPKLITLFRRGRGAWKSLFTVDEDVSDDEARKQFLYTQVVGLVVTFVNFCIAIPLHITSALNSQTAVVYMEGSPVGTSTNYTWGDCFSLQPPTDLLGFLAFWWAEETAKAVHVLAFL
jgi:hypothetical protein